MKLLFLHSTKFLHCNNKYYTAGGLDDQVFARYTKIFDQVSVVARIIASHPNQARFSEITDPKITIKSINDIKLSGLKQEVKKADCVIGRLPSRAARYGVKYARRYQKPYLVEIVGCAWDAYWNHSFKGKLVAPYMWFTTKCAIKSAPYAVYVTNEFLQKRYPSAGKTIGCSDVSLPMLDNDILEKRIVKIKDMTHNQPIIIGTSAAVNVRYKGQQYIIEAIAKLNKQGYNFEYYLVGGGDNKYLKSVAKKYGVIDKVKFLGLLPHDKVFEYLDNVDIYVQPSKQEGLPRALVEAMSRGCPAIGSTTGGIPELLDKEWIFKNADVNNICQILMSIDKQAMLSMANNNFEKAKEYNKELLEQRRNIFYKEFAKEAGNKSD